jgi:hypothetical protein
VTVFLYLFAVAFIINKITSGQQVPDIALAVSRFRAEVATPRKGTISIRTVRLTYKKDYCGNHPLPCPVRPGPHRKHPVNCLLEGADWVAFNDMVNDVLDQLGVVCNCASSHVIIRKAGARCVKYTAHRLGNGIDNEWDKDSGEFAYHVKHTPIATTFNPVNVIVDGIDRGQVVDEAPRAEYPAGTPGFATPYGQPNYPEHSH